VQLRKEFHDSINTFPDGCIRSNNFFIFLSQQVLKKIKQVGYIYCTLVQVRWASKGGLKGSKRMGITGSQPGLLLPISANPLTASRISASPFHSSFCLGLFDTRVVAQGEVAQGELKKNKIIVKQPDIRLKKKFSYPQLFICKSHKYMI
jgi:hypothetical protein